MESITFRCGSCLTLLRARAEKAGRKARCTRCGELTVIPSPAPSQAEDEQSQSLAEDARVARHRQLEVDAEESEAQQPAKKPAPPRKRPRVQKSSASLAVLRSAPAWRKVRLGLYLLALSLCLVVVWIVAGFFVRLSLYVWISIGQIIPLVGNSLCAFVPLKGTARRLAIANLMLIALGFFLLIMAQRKFAQVFRSSDQIQDVTSRFTQESTEGDKEDQDLTRAITELDKKRTPGDKEVPRQINELVQKRAKLRENRVAERLEALKKNLAELETETNREVSRIRFWAWFHGNGLMLLTALQGIVLALFVWCIASSLEDKGLAANCPRVILFILGSLVLGLILQFVKPTIVVLRLFGAINYFLFFVGYVLQGLMLVEACKTIDNHLDPHPGSG